MTELQASPDSVLVYVGGDLVGDGVMKLPFLRALRHACPQARITWMAGKYKSAYAHELAPLVEGLLDEVIEEAGFDANARWLLRRPLPERQFDLIIDTQRGVVASLILRRVRHRCFVSGAADFLLSDIRPPRPHRRPAAMIRQMLELLALATGGAPAFGPPPQLDHGFAAEAKRRLPAGPVYIGLAPGAGGRHKCWPLENFIALARAQLLGGRAPVFILGPAEQAWRAGLAAAVPEALFPLSDDDSGDDDSGDDDSGSGVSRSPVFTIAVASRLAAAVANDSGTGHMIAAADVPMVSLFGPTRPEKFAPTATRLTILEARCFGDGNGDGDMAAIPVEAAARAVEAALAGRRDADH